MAFVCCFTSLTKFFHQGLATAIMQHLHTHIYSIQLSFLTAAIQFQILSPPNQADERHPGVINIPILVTLDPVTSVLQNDVSVFVSVVGGTATGRKIAWSGV